MNDSARLIFTGNVIVDIVMTVDGVPEPGGDTIASDSQITAGGGYNVMVAAQRDGLPVVYAGQYGTGPFGDVVRAALDAGGFGIAQAGVQSRDSGYCVALIDSSAERTFVTSVGAESELDRADLDRIEMADDDIVYVSGYSLAHPRNAVALTGWLGDLPSDVLVDHRPVTADRRAGPGCARAGAEPDRRHQRQCQGGGDRHRRTRTVPRRQGHSRPR